jgi:hypothetical protein
MNSRDIVNRRISNQQIAGERFTEPSELVQWMGCMRAEDLAAAKWAIGTRVVGSTERGIEQAIHEGKILRTHVLQPEWYFVAPADIRWMLALTSSRLRSFNKGIYHTLGIDASILKKSKRIIRRTLENGHRTRAQLWDVLKKAHIQADELRMGWLLMDAELDGLICGGGLAGQDFTYALLDQMVPVAGAGEREELIAGLVLRYFCSRGPATVLDFVKWSGLHLKEANIGLGLNSRWLGSEVVDGEVYWFDPSAGMVEIHNSIFLLPALDEWAMAYSGRNCFKPMLVIDGKISGSWTAIMEKNSVTIMVTTPVKKNGQFHNAIQIASKKYSSFLGRKLLIT